MFPQITTSLRLLPSSPPADHGSILAAALRTLGVNDGNYNDIPPDGKLGVSDSEYPGSQVRLPARVA